MATVTKPIALDESLNTTEVTPRNIADVLAQELEGIAQALTPVQPSASGVSYDNTASGLAADDVQDAIDELADEKANTADLAAVATSGSYNDLTNKPTIPTVNDGTLTIKKNGETIQTFSANQSANATANIPGDTEVITDTEPYVLRQGKGDLVDMEIVGASVAWNQLVQNGNFADTSGWTTSSGSLPLTVSNNVGTFAPISRGQQLRNTSAKFVLNHTYLIRFNVVASSGVNSFMVYNAMNDAITLGENVIIRKVTSAPDYEYLFFYLNENYNSQTLDLEKVNVIDLTASLGTTIADYIYSLEQNNAGDGVAWFRQYFPNAYYGYDPGSIQSVNVSGRKVVGKNLLNHNSFANGLLNTNTGEAEYTARWITSDYVYVGTGGSVAIQGWKRGTEDNYCVRFCEYDVSKNFIKNTSNINVSSTDHYSLIITLDARTRYVRASFGFSNKNTSVSDFFGTNDIQLELGSTATPYEPYTTTTYPLDSSKELRGLFQLVNGKLKAYGDIYPPSGSITRKFTLIDLGAQNWTYESTADHERIRSTTAVSTLKGSDSNTSYGNILCLKYVTVTASNTYQHTAIGIAISPDKHLYVYDPTYTDAATFKTAMNGVYLVAELATPTTESADPYQNPQRAYPDGTEEFIDALVDAGTRDVAIPVGNNSVYTTNEVIEPIADYVDAMSVGNVYSVGLGTGYLILCGKIGIWAAITGPATFSSVTIAKDGITLPIKRSVTAICRYYSGSNVYGYLKLDKEDSTLHLYSAGDSEVTNGSYVVGSIVFMLE